MPRMSAPWLPSPEAAARVARHRGCTPEAAKLQIVDAGKSVRIKARGMIEGRSKGWGFPVSPDPTNDRVQAPVSPLPAAWNGTINLTNATMRPPEASYEITSLELCFIDLIAAGSLPAPAERAQWPAAEAIAYWVTGISLPWKTWMGVPLLQMGISATASKIEQAEIVLGEAIGADLVRAWGRLSPEGPMEPIPSSDLRIPGFKWRVGFDGNLGTSPPGRLAVFKGRRWYGIEVDSATVRQLVTVRAAPAAAVGDAGAVTSGETEAPSEPEPEHTRWQRERAIAAIKTLHSPDGIRPKGVSIAALTIRINKLLELKENQISEDTVGRALEDIKAALKK